MQDYEKLGVFYLGRPYDLATRSPGEGLILYDARDLVTHGVCVGMTGSGKTGLCVTFLEEAALDGVPAVVIDPKGDLANLLLTFPDLRPADFAPWVNEDEARKQGLTVEEYAGRQAETWKEGLASWGQDGERIRRLREAADFAVYTPGSTAGLPVSILKSFAAPPRAIVEDAELLGDRVRSTATSLLGLLGRDADPIRSREHILLSGLFGRAWAEGRDLDLGALIREIQSPPMTQVGVMDLESFYPSSDRFELALAFNNLLAAPGFGTWLEGEALDLDLILHAPDGKPRVAIFSIAHLNDAERMFFVSLLLNQVLAWTRTQTGTTSLRAIVYMDEVFGYLPPVANPPSKLPLLTLLKQARAFGVGVLLATQNPVDLDYKALSNAGTWLIGRLQTERDKARVLEGLEGVAAGAGKTFDRRGMEETLAGLTNRVFLMNNVHEDAPVVFETRWAMSYLRGPLTRAQIKILMDPRRGASAPARPASSGEPAPEAAVRAAAAPQGAAPSARPVVPPGITEYFAPAGVQGPEGSSLAYGPAVLGAARVRFADARSGVDTTRDVSFVTPITGDAIPVDWNRSEAFDRARSELGTSPHEPARYDALPAAAAKAASYDRWGRDLAAWVYGGQGLELLKSASLGLVSAPGESERDFRVRLEVPARERRDEAVGKLREKYATKTARLEEQVRRAEEAVRREGEQAQHEGIQTVISLGAAILGGFAGRKRLGVSSIGRATTAARGVSRTMRQREDTESAKEKLAFVQQQAKDLQAEFDAEVAALSARVDPVTEELQRVRIRPDKKDIEVRLAALVWLPRWDGPGGQSIRAW